MGLGDYDLENLTQESMRAIVKEAFERGKRIEINEVLYDFYAHLEHCPGVDVNGIWEAIRSFDGNKKKNQT